MKYLLRIIAMMTLVTSLLACGFQLRGVSQFTYQSVYITGNTQINQPLIGLLKTNGVKLVSDPAQADLQLELLNEESEKRILALSGAGVVREFELYYRVHYRTRLSSEPMWDPPQTVEARRDFSFSDNNFLAKQAEERLLNANMRSDVVNALARRLATIKK